MQRVGYLFESVVSYENLLIAFHKAYRGKKTKEKENYYFALENNLIELQKKLKDNIYTPQNYSYFILRGLKDREISVAKFEDRVVQHAIINIIEPIYEKRFISDSYATRKNKGVIKAIKKCQEQTAGNSYYLKCDIEKYFDNINHEILLEKIERKIKDKKLIILIGKILKNSDLKRGLPIGNLTSQFFANVYLDSIDHYLKDKLSIKNYVRYMDDFVIQSSSKEEIKKIKKLVERFLELELNLKLKEKATFSNNIEVGIPFCGVRIFRKTIRIRKESLKISIYKIKEKLKLFKSGEISESDLVMTLNSIFSYWKNYDTCNLRKKIIERYIDI